MKKILIFCFVILCFSTLLLPYILEKHNVIPDNGYVPDEATAIKIAETILTTIYGIDKVKNEKPFKAKLNKRGIWEINGSIPVLLKGTKYLGGVAEIEIRKSDCKIIRVSHGK